MLLNTIDADDALYQTSMHLIGAKEHSPRGKKTKELINLGISILRPEKCIITNPGRNLSEDYLRDELKWYLSGDRSVEFIGQRASLWQKIANEDGLVNSNYGHIVFNQEMSNFDGNQYDWVISSLKKDPDSRQAIINFNQPFHKYKDNKDFVCTINTQYLQRDNKIIGITNMRSNDLIYGFSYDLPFFSWLQERVANDLGKEVGTLYHNAASMHVYEKHFKMLKKICDHASCRSKKLTEVLNGETN